MLAPIVAIEFALTLLGGTAPAAPVPVAAPLPVRDLLIARHGQTEWNRLGRSGGDPEINAQGYEDRVSLLLALRDVAVDEIFTSELRRTKLTAALVASVRGMTPIADGDLDELRSGAFEGICRRTLGATELRPDEARCRDGEIDPAHPAIAWLREEYAKRDRDKFGFRPPGGESYADGLVRIDRFFARRGELLRSRRVLIVAHGGTNRLLLARAMGWPVERAVRIRQDNNWVFRVQRTARGPQLSIYRDGAWRPCSGLPDPKHGLECAR
ncbi:MAG: histidine phosphatase family protein [Deltaproteobacteria bacterium]|nr:histidine phosphatase family protein [Deltaproteobacteria bacterium]